MVFDRKKAVGNGKEASSSNAAHFMDKLSLLRSGSNMLKHCIGVNDIEFLVLKRKGLPGLNFYVLNTGIGF